MFKDFFKFKSSHRRLVVSFVPRRGWGAAAARIFFFWGFNFRPHCEALEGFLGGRLPVASSAPRRLLRLY